MNARTSLKSSQSIIFIFLATVLISTFVSYKEGICLSSKPSEIELNVSMSNIRSEIKQYIDELYYFNILSIEHTTDSISPPPKKRIPKKPQPFDAGRFKITFGKKEESRAIICQTESIVGHYAKVVPGKTDIGGHIQILDDPTKDISSGPTLNDSEVDYFIQMIYRKFSKPITNKEEILLNKVKDIGLAILFSGKEGIEDYHKQQIRKLKSSD